MELPTIQVSGYFNSDIKFPNQKITNVRDVKRYEIEYILSDGGVSVINEKEYPILSDHMIIGKPGDKRYSRLMDGVPFRTVFMKFEAQGEIAARLEGLPSEFPLLHTEQIMTLLKELVSNMSSADADDCYIGGKFLLLLHFISKDAAIDAPHLAPFYGRMHDAKKYMETHYKEPIKNEDVANALYLSESHFRCLFRALYGITPHAYLTEVRIDAAKKLLATSTLSYADIGSLCRLGSTKNFITVFHKMTGMTPAKFRREAVRRYTE